MQRIGWALVITAWATAGCGGAGQPGHTFEIIEEDGVPTGINSAIPKFDGELFTYEKILTIRPDPDIEESLLYQPFSFTLADDGNYYVADRGNHRIAAFDVEGDFVRAFGREGDGPGELRSPVLVEVDGDEVMVFDNRTSIFRRDGTFVGLVTSAEGRYPHPLPGGMLFVQGTTGSTREDRNYFGARGRIIDPDGETVAEIETDQIHMDAMLAYAGAPAVMLTPRNEIVATTGVEPMITWYGLDGGLLRRARIDFPPQPVTEADRRAIEDVWDERIDRERNDAGQDIIPAEYLLELKESVVYPDSKAYWERPLIDDAGWLWLPVPAADTNLATIGQAPIENRPRFLIVDAGGEFIGTTDWPEDALTPRGATIIDGRLLTMVWDEQADEYVPTVYRISPAAGGFAYPPADR